MRAIAVVDGFWVVEVRVRQVKIGSKSCFGYYIQQGYYEGEVFTSIAVKTKDNTKKSFGYFWVRPMMASLSF